LSWTVKQDQDKVDVMFEDRAGKALLLIRRNKMKTTRLFCLLIVLFSCSASLVFAEANPKHFPVGGGEVQSIKMEKMHDQITMMQQNIESMSSLLMQMSSVLKKENLTGEQQKECGYYLGKIATSMMACTEEMSATSVAQQKMETEKLEKEWNYWESEFFESH
jgi:hypothetical protein